MVAVSGNSNPTNPTYPTNPTNPTNPTTLNSGELTDKNLSSFFARSSLCQSGHRTPIRHIPEVRL